MKSVEIPSLILGKNEKNMTLAGLAGLIQATSPFLKQTTFVLPTSSFIFFSNH